MPLLCLSLLILPGRTDSPLTLRTPEDLPLTLPAHADAPPLPHTPACLFDILHLILFFSHPCMLAQHLASDPPLPHTPACSHNILPCHHALTSLPCLPHTPACAAPDASAGALCGALQHGGTLRWGRGGGACHRGPAGEGERKQGGQVQCSLAVRGSRGAGTGKGCRTKDRKRSDGGEGAGEGEEAGKAGVERFRTRWGRGDWVMKRFRRSNTAERGARLAVTARAAGGDAFAIHRHPRCHLVRSQPHWPANGVCTHTLVWTFPFLFSARLDTTGGVHAAERFTRAQNLNCNLHTHGPLDAFGIVCF